MIIRHVYKIMKPHQSIRDIQSKKKLENNMRKNYKKKIKNNCLSRTSNRDQQRRGSKIYKRIKREE